jgi:uncharacterized membrane protein YfcA
MHSPTLSVVAVFFLATLVRSTFGFGEALVAVPLLAFVLPVEIAAPVAVLVSITVAAFVVARDWRHVQVRSAAWLVFSTLFGIPIGLLLLRTAPETIVKLLLGLLVAGFSAWSLVSVHAHELKNDRLAWLFGWLAGILGGAYGMNGPPLAVYGALRRWPPAQFRATLQGYFLPASVLGLIGYWAAGLWTPVVTRYYVMTLPAVALAILLSRLINRRLDGGRFLVYVHALLIAVGVTLVAQSLVIPLHAQQAPSDTSADRIRRTLETTQPAIVFNASLPPLVDTPDVKRLGIFTLAPPESNGEIIRISIPIGELAMRAIDGVANARHRRVERKAHEEVMRAVADFKAQHP